MLAASGEGWLAGASGIIGLVAAFLGLLKYVNWRSKRDRIAAVGAAFETVVNALASESDVKRLAAAIRLRRFFDRDSEVGVAGAAYAQEALNVGAGILREQRAGNFQKLLADGLAYAPSLVNADLQRTNLQGAYLGRTDVSNADFYRADLSHASLRSAIARNAKFYQARLVDTVFTEADLRGANFFQADLTRARFTGARLAGANFAGSRAVPPEIASQLDADGLFIGVDEPFSTERLPRPPGSPSVFVSRPSVLTPAQEATWRLVQHTLAAADVETVTVARSDYPAAGILGDLHRAMTDCTGVVVLGFRQLEVSSGRWRPGTPEELMVDGLALATPWNQVEVGIAAALGLPIFVLRDSGVTGGIFDAEGDYVMVVADLDQMLASDQATSSLDGWVRALG